MDQFLRSFEELLIELRKRGFKTSSEYINYLYADLKDYPNRAHTLFKYYGVR